MILSAQLIQLTLKAAKSLIEAGQFEFCPVPGWGGDRVRRERSETGHDVPDLVCAELAMKRRHPTAPSFEDADPELLIAPPAMPVVRREIGSRRNVGTNGSTSPVRSVTRGAELPKKCVIRAYRSGGPTRSRCAPPVAWTGRGSDAISGLSGVVSPSEASCPGRILGDLESSTTKTPHQTDDRLNVIFSKLVFHAGHRASTHRGPIVPGRDRSARYAIQGR